VPVSISSRGLPGIGVGHELQLRDGTRLGVVTRRTGKRDLLLYSSEDPDEASAKVVLTEAGANAMAEILGGPAIGLPTVLAAN
jgi:TrkA domain protein